MQDDSSNGESTFEFIEKKADGEPNEQTVTEVVAGNSLLSNVAPPSALPSFVPQPPVTTAETGLPKAVHTFHPTTFSPVIHMDKGSTVNSPDSGGESCTVTTTAPTASSISGVGGLFSWVRDAVGNNGILTKVADRAKSSVDSMITTLDPQMKEFLSSAGGQIEVIVASDKEVKISPVREAFHNVFGSGETSVKGLAAEARTVATQPVGFEAGLKAAWLRIDSIRSLQPEGPIVAIENFLVEITPEKWYDVGAIVLSDSGRGIVLETFTQSTPVPSAIVALAREDTPADYPLSSTGFAITVGHLMARNLHVHPSEWHQALTGVSRREMILLAARTLANIYKNSLL